MQKNTTMKYLITICFIFSIGISSSKAQWSIKGETTENNAGWNLLQKFTNKYLNSSNFATEQDMEWFNDASYGMFIHFGLSTYKETDLSWSICETRKAPDRGSGDYPDSVWVFTDLPAWETDPTSLTSCFFTAQAKSRRVSATQSAGVRIDRSGAADSCQ